MVSTGVVWFRRDLRLADNPALTGALRAHRTVVPLFVWDHRLAGPAGVPRLAFLQGCLRELDRSLGGRLLVRRGDPVDVVPEVAAATGARDVWCAADFGPYGSTRDVAVARALERLPDGGPRLRRVGSPYAVEPGELRTAAGRPFQVFTPFLRAWRSADRPAPTTRPRLSPVTGAPPPAVTVARELPSLPPLDASLPEPGEAAAHRRLEHFAARLDRYDEDRDRPDLDGTSRLSPYLRFGCLHPRQLLGLLDPDRPAHRRFAAELCWRDFFADVLWHRPDTARAAARPRWAWPAADSGPEADARFDAWASGRTGYPFVDAGMRQLLGEAWVHNRVRMVVASFLVKDLHLPWQRGARWFMRHLVDGDLASNQHGWQWVAGTGTDASPFHRVFNPVTQGRRHDPEGDYVRRWVPELAALPGALVHEPWRAGAGPGPAVPSGYPPPLVDHAQERREALARAARARQRHRPPA